jgi:hypothetical protein
MSQDQTQSKPASAEQPRDEGLSSGVLFAVGDRVIAAETLDGYPNDDWPLMIYCKKGAQLEVREVRPNGWYVVAHLDAPEGQGFTARHRELLPANDNVEQPAPTNTDGI